VRITLHKCRIHKTAQNSSDNLPSYHRDSHHCSDIVYWREGGLYDDDNDRPTVADVGDNASDENQWNDQRKRLDP